MVLVEAKWLTENDPLFTDGQMNIFTEVCAERGSIMIIKGYIY